MAHEIGAPGGVAGAGPGGNGGGTCGAPTLHILGGFELRIGGQAVLLPANGRRVLACLALAGPAMRRDALAGRVWTWSSQARAQANLRNALWRIRRVDRRVVEADNDEVRLGGDVAVDLRASAQHARKLIERPAACAAHAAGTAVQASLLEADILPDWDDDWVLLERERHRQLRIHGLEALSHGLADAGRFAQAVDAAYAAIAAEPLRESAHAALISAYLAEGNRAEAARQFAAYERLIDEELGLPPSPRIVALLDPVMGRSR
jgi:DNA-binding SARP family transcriptional activator